MITVMKKQTVIRKPDVQSAFINIRVLRTTNKRIRLFAAQNECTVPEAIDRKFAE